MSEAGKQIMVTGGAGFIGRWVVAELLEQGHQVRVFDDLSSGSAANLAEFEGRPGFEGLTVSNIRNRAAVEAFFSEEVDLCYHLAAKVNVQHSLEAPREVLTNDVVGTFNVLEAARRRFFARGGPAAEDGVLKPKVVFVSTCMVYTPALSPVGIDEEHPVRPLSPYAACKLAGEQLALSYFHAYGLPVTVLRPFNTFGPYQRTDMEGGVVAVFLRRALRGEPLLVRGDGQQTRDLLYVRDCARFIVAAGLNPSADGRILNAGSACEISINTLAQRIARERCTVRHVPHAHPQAEIARLLCNNAKASRVLGWRPRYGLDEALAETEDWVRRALPEPVGA